MLSFLKVRPLNGSASPTPNLPYPSIFQLENGVPQIFSSTTQEAAYPGPAPVVTTSLLHHAGLSPACSSALTSSAVTHVLKYRVSSRAAALYHHICFVLFLRTLFI